MTPRAHSGSEGVGTRAIGAGERRGGGARVVRDIVQYLPCAARPDSAEAREIAKEAVGAMLIALWPSGNDWPAQRETIVRLSGIARPEMVGALDRLRRGSKPGECSMTASSRVSRSPAPLSKS